MLYEVITLLTLGIDLAVIGIDLQPGRSSGETGVGADMPLHRGAAVVAGEQSYNFV